MAIIAPGAFPARSTADFAAFVGVALMLADILGTFVRSIGYRIDGLDSLQHLRDFLLLQENRDPRVVAPSLLLGADNDTAAWPNGRSQSRRYPSGGASSEFVAQFIDVSVTLNGAEPVLKNLSLRIPRGKVTMITGSVGCGKSTFLRSMIGQVQLSCGSLIVVSTCVAYCSQKPWIRNVSIRDNIVGEKPFNRTWLNLILYICALDIDLARMASGELTVAGSDGCNLSGGQKQRVVSTFLNSFYPELRTLINVPKAFARALYAKKEIIIVDDLFSVLDKNTSSAIRIRLFGETEILNANNMTLIMSTTMRMSEQGSHTVILMAE